MRYTIAVDASFHFDINASSREEAERIAREKLRTRDPIMDDHGLALSDSYDAPWVAVAGMDNDFPSLEVVDVFGEEEEA